MNDKYKELLERYKNNESKVFFYVVDIDNYPLVSQWEAFYHSWVLKQNNIDTYILFDDSNTLDKIESVNKELEGLIRKGVEANRGDIADLKERKKMLEDVFPDWIDSIFREVPIIKTSEANKSMNVSAIDMIVIPEHFKNVAFQFSKLPSKNVISIHNITSFFRESVVNIGYIKDMNINTFLIANPHIENIVRSNDTREGRYFEFKTIKPTIPSYFRPAKLKAPRVAIFAKNEDDIQLVHKVFCTRYPSMAWITFDVFNMLEREQFAKKLSTAAVGVMLDRKSTFGTFPMECLASKAYPIVLEPEYPMPFADDKDGNATVFYTYKLIGGKDNEDNYNDIPELIYKAVMQYLMNGLEDEFFADAIEANKNCFESPEKNDKIVKTYKAILEGRYNDIEKKLKEEETETQK